MRYLVFSTILLFASCIGTDFVDDPLVEKKIAITSEANSVMTGTTLQMEGIYYNEFGIAVEESLTWQSSNTAVASVDNNGLLTANMAGQVMIKATFESVESESLLITIIDNPDELAEVVLTGSSNLLSVGGSLQLSVKLLNGYGEEIDGEVTWQSSNNDVATVSSAGLVTGKSNGEVSITASSQGISSQQYQLTVGSAEKVATFMGGNGYVAKGAARLYYDNNDNLILGFSEDFETSFALGTFIYLSNTTTGSQVAASGLGLGEITTNGAKSFNITALDASVELDTYQYVIVLCKPAAITFGYANFNE
ncbi:Ig-like domain-containing protein [Fulvivirga ligni]|uniref:Ig-like domain-containing protein n=1 Tax=Fulvivirga ligni TaxID=2904246 RepID=UPI001F1F356E|nr:Ig-like domain-containing protein [Fulvivirga ligni]UII22223.1 Ig-like domain-containing protein [Fulvivirga ligni]